VALVIVMAAIGIAYAVWNATQPHVRLFVVNESPVAGSLRFADGSVVAVPACSSARYSDEPAARWTLTSATGQLASDTIGATSGAIVTVTIAADGTIATQVAMAIDAGVLSVAPPDLGPCATAAP
jgi:hypothetical protein